MVVAPASLVNARLGALAVVAATRERDFTTRPSVAASAVPDPLYSPCRRAR